MRLENQVALITGASHGLGLAIARSLSAEGAAIACMARGGAKLDEAVAGLRAAGARAIAAPGDVTNDAEVAGGVRRTLEEWGRLDILVINAGTWAGSPIQDTTEQAWDAMLDLNLKGAFLALRHAIPWMIGQRRGTVVGISSIGGLVGMPGAAAYAASKWGLRGLLESAALELKPHRIRVSLVHPHNMNSAGAPITPGTEERDRRIETADVASMVSWICTAPDYVGVGNVTVWPIHAGIKAQL